MDVADASKIQSPGYLVIDRVDSSGTLKSTSLWEFVKVTNISSNTLTITRGQGGSTGQAHSSGAVVESVMTAALMEEYYNALNPEHTATGGHVITGVATVAGMNLASVASIAVLSSINNNFINLALSSIASVAMMRFSTYLNASGASISGTFTPGFKIGSFTRDISIASGTQAVTGVGFQGRLAIFLATGAQAAWSVGMDDGTNVEGLGAYPGPNYAISTNSISTNDNSGNVYTGKISAWGADGFTITWTKTGTTTGTLTIAYLVII